MTLRQRYFYFLLFLPFLVVSQTNDGFKAIDKLESTFQIINYAYVDEVDPDLLVEQSIISTLGHLDPYSQYISKEELRKSTEELVGNFDGIGITYQVYNDTVVIIATTQNGPAQKGGLLPGDKIIKVNDEDFTGVKLTETYISARMRGPKGSDVEISVLRGRKARKIINTTVTRDKIPIKSVVGYYMVNNDIGYIKIERFARTTVNEFREAFVVLQNAGMKSLILDLRGNTGGFFDAAVSLADEFLDHGKMIVYTQGAASPKRRYKSSFIGHFTEGHMVVLIDGKSASASEIVAGALQDWGRAVIIGRRSYGKGLVQRPYFLPDSSVIRLTIAKYYSPTGRCIQKPYQENEIDLLKELEDKLIAGDPVKMSALGFPDSLTYTTDNGRTVYGGGGIMPDIYVKGDTLRINKLYLKLVNADIINGYVMEFMDINREDLNKKFNSFEKFETSFSITKKMVDDFRSFSQKCNIYIDPFEFEPIKPIVINDITALIARHLFGVNHYYQIMNQKDKDFHKAIQVLESNAILAELHID